MICMCMLAYRSYVCMCVAHATLYFIFFPSKHFQYAIFVFKVMGFNRAGLSITISTTERPDCVCYFFCCFCEIEKNNINAKRETINSEKAGIWARNLWYLLQKKNFFLNIYALCRASSFFIFCCIHLLFVLWHSFSLLYGCFCIKYERNQTDGLGQHAITGVYICFDLCEFDYIARVHLK